MRDAKLLVDISESCGTKPGLPLSHSQRLDGGPDSWPPQRTLGNRPPAASTETEVSKREDTFKLKPYSDNYSRSLTGQTSFFAHSFNYFLCWDHQQHLCSLISSLTPEFWCENQIKTNQNYEPVQVAKFNHWCIVGIRFVSYLLAYEFTAAPSH